MDIGYIIAFILGLFIGTKIKKPEDQRAASDSNKLSSEIEKIIQDFGAFIEQHGPLPTRIEDVSCLPYPKQKILNALIATAAYTDDVKMRDSLETGAMLLAQYQDGVGNQPLEMMGVDITKLPLPKTLEESKKQAKFLVEMEAKTKERFNHFQQLVDADLKNIKGLIAAARTTRKEKEI